MDFLNKNKITISAVLIFSLALWIYSSFFKGGNVVVTSDTNADSVGADVLSLNSSLQSVSLDQSLFTTSLYRNLVDFSTAIPSQSVGRTNPFDIIGRN